MSEVDNEVSGEQTSVKKPNPLLERFNKMPPETFRMPSGGVLYTNGEVDEEVINGEVIVYPMTTVDEITMRSPDMLFQGTAVEKVFNRCIPQIRKPFDILSNDVDYLLICLRMVTYGENIEVYWDCPKCADKKGEEAKELRTENVRLDDPREEANRIANNLDNVKPTHTVSLSKFLQKAKPLKIHNNPAYVIKLDTGETVKLRPSTFGEMLRLYQDVSGTELETPEEMTEFIIDGVLSVIDSVDGHKNRDDIREWAMKCKAPVLQKIHDAVQNANDWGSSAQKHDFKCEVCGHETEIEVPLNPIHFFTAPSTTQIEA